MVIMVPSFNRGARAHDSETILVWGSRFSVSSVGSRRWHHSDSGSLSSTPANIAMKCTLKA